MSIIRSQTMGIITTDIGAQTIENNTALESHSSSMKAIRDLETNLTDRVL